MSSGPKKAKLRRHAPCSHFPRLSRCPCVTGDVSAPSRPRDRKPRSAATSDGAEERAPPPTARGVERAFWVALRESWPVWASRLVIVNADTVARWNRDRFRRYWTRISSRRCPGRPRIDAEIRRSSARWLATRSRVIACAGKEVGKKHAVYPHRHPTRACGLCAVQPVRSLADNVLNWVHTW